MSVIEITQESESWNAVETWDDQTGGWFESASYRLGDLADAIAHAKDIVRVSGKRARVVTYKSRIFAQN